MITASAVRRRLLGLPLPLLLLLTLPACRSDPDAHKDPAAGAASATLPAGHRAPAPAASGEGWNAQQIDWQGYDAGMARAKAEKKPVCLVFYTSWCPHCKNFSHVFDDPKVVERAKSFVMIRINADEQEAVASKYTKDGKYIPRTFFLAPDGTLADIHAPRTNFLYFYDEHQAAPLLASMDAATRLVP